MLFAEIAGCAVQVVALVLVISVPFAPIAAMTSALVVVLVPQVTAVKSAAVFEVTAVQVFPSVLVIKVPLAPTAIHRPVPYAVTAYKSFVVAEFVAAAQFFPSVLVM